MMMMMNYAFKFQALKCSVRPVSTAPRHHHHHPDAFPHLCYFRCGGEPPAASGEGQIKAENLITKTYKRELGHIVQHIYVTCILSSSVNKLKAEKAI